MEQKSKGFQSPENAQQPEQHDVELGVDLQEGALTNKYLERTTTSVMQDYVKVGVAEYLGRMTKEEVDALYDNGQNSFETPLSPCAVYSEDGTKVIGYDVYRGNRGKFEALPNETEVIKQKSDDLYRKMPAAIERQKAKILEAGVTEGRLVNLGDMSSEQVDRLFEQNPEIYKNLISLLVYDDAGNLVAGHRKVFILK
jgi:hypothetical protein